MKRFLILSASVCLWLPGNSQQTTSVSQVASEFRMVNQAYSAAENLQMDVNYALYPSYTSTSAVENETGVYMKQGKSTYSHLLGTVSLTNEKMSLALDSNEQTIVLTDPPSKADRSPSLVNLDSLLSICSSVESKDAGGELLLYKLKFDRTPFFEYNSIEVFINKNSHFIDRFILYYRMEIDVNENDDSYVKDRPRLDIHYTNISTDPVFAPDQFSEKKFVQSAGKNFSCSSAYAKFRLINNKLK